MRNHGAKVMNERPDLLFSVGKQRFDKIIDKCVNIKMYGVGNSWYMLSQATKILPEFCIEELEKERKIVRQEKLKRILK